MPPIFGIYALNQKEPDKAVIKRLSQQATYHVARRISSLHYEGGWLATGILEHRDRNRGKEILHYSEGLLIAADAALYKREELKRKLKSNIANQNITDSMLILESYRTWGDQCLKHLYGDYAFIIINTRKKEIFCGRDALGVKPFYYTLIDDYFVFGSELRYLISSFRNRPEIQKFYRLETLVKAKAAKDSSIYRGILRLPPGCILNYKNNKRIVTPYWALDPNYQIVMKSEKDYLELFREKLLQAVTMRCSNAIQIGAELSGGLDSSGVIGIAAKYAKDERIPLTAFSNVFPELSGNRFEDERKYISMMIEFLNINWIALDQLNANIVKLLEDAIGFQGCYLQQDFSTFNVGIYKASRDQEIDVLLSGFGGDELVSSRTAMPWNELLHNGQWRTLFDELFYKGGTIRPVLRLTRIIAKYLLEDIHHPALKTRVFKRDLLDKRFARLPLQADFTMENNLRQMFTEKHKVPVRKTLAERQVDRLMANHLPQRLEYCYAAAAQYGIEYRYPLLDVDLIETYLAFPPWMKQHHGVNRYVFREAIKGFVPEEIRTRNDKSGSTIPHVYHSLVEERESILALIKKASKIPELNRVFDFSKFEPWYESLVRRDAKEMNSLMPGAFYQYLMMLIYYMERPESLPL